MAKLEERYIAKHKENNELSSDRSILSSFLETILEKPLDKKVDIEEL